MSRFILEFSTDNSAFGESLDDEMAETSRIIADIADRILGTAATNGHIRDSNGNTIGRWEFDSGASSGNLRAAAPELLASLRDIHAIAEGSSFDTAARSLGLIEAKAKIAIAKAEGEA